jgi:hypothetical protein
MALNRLQKAVINSHKDPRASGLNGQNIFFQIRTHNFFNTSDGDFYSKKNGVSQVYTYLPKIQKKSKKIPLSSMLKLRSVRAILNVITYLSFVFPNNLIWLIYYIVTQ